MVEPRPAKPTVQFVDEYCQWYQPLFPEVRSFEAFKQLHLGLISEVKRKSLPAIATVAGLDNAQSLHHFLTESPWQIDAFRQHRLKLILQTLGERECWSLMTQATVRKGITLITLNDSTSVTWAKLRMGLLLLLLMESSRALRFLCSSRSTNQRTTQTSGYLPQQARNCRRIRELKAMGFRFKLVLADSLYGESGCGFINVLYELKLDFVVAIRSNHAVRCREQTVAIDGASLSACSAMVN